tara:strand:+ start:9498 stop:9860 length:363 start_codon:yes stop_codon:yes gene_type:complete
MKSLYIIIISLLFSSFGYSQEIDARLLKSYTSEELSELIISDNDKYKTLILAIESGVAIFDFPAEKSKKVTKEITLPKGDFTYLDLGLKIEESNQYFKIKNSNKMLIVKSFYVLKHELNK